jgi:alpha-N-arabinofuranosidase
MFRQPPFHTLALYSRHCGNTALDCAVEVETFSTPSYKDVPFVDVSATNDAGTQRIALIATNLHPTSPFDAAIEIRGVTPSAQAEVYELNAPHLDTENSFEHPGAVSLARKARIAGRAIKPVRPT